MTRVRSVVLARLISFALMPVLWLVAIEAIAFQLSPTSITDSEGTRVTLRVTVSRADWQKPDSNWISQCAGTGVPDADWVSIMQFHFLDGTAEFGVGSANGDINLLYSGTRVDDNRNYFKCATGPDAPTANQFWSEFAIELNQDTIEEGPESATLYLHSIRIGNFPLIAGSINININGNYEGPYSDWQVSVSDVMPTMLYAGDDISIKATGNRTVNPEYSYDDGWTVSYLLSTNSAISLSDTVLETRSSEGFADSFNETWTGSLNVQPGTYWVGTCSVIADDDASNDCSTGVEITVLDDILPPSFPDLDVVFLDADPTTVVTGESMDVTTHIENIGPVTAGPSTLRFYLTEDSLAGEDDILIANSGLPQLEPGLVWKLTASIPVEVDPGEYYVLVCADSVVNESAVDNNCSIGPVITVLSDLSDTCIAQPLACGDVIASVLDPQDCTAGPRGKNYYARKFTYNGAVGDRLFLKASWAGSLDGYAFIEGPNGLTVAQNDNYTGASDSRIEYEVKQNGEFTVWATSFATSATGAFELSLDCDNPPGPDLVLDAPATGAEVMVPGQKMVVSTRLRNVGDDASDSTRLRYVLSSNSLIERSDTELGSDRSDRLAAGSSRAASRDLIAPSTPGTYYLGVCADVVPGEASASNNCSPGTAIVIDQRPACRSRRVSCGEFVSGSLSTLDCTDSPRGDGFLSEALNIDVSAGRVLVFDAEWNDFDGYLVLTDPSGAVVAEDDDSVPGSHIEYKTAQGGIHELWMTSFERNDTGSFGIDIRCGASVAPDLSATLVSVDSSDVSVGQSLGLSGTVLNNGNMLSGATRVNVLLSSDDRITPSDDIIEIIELPSVGAGASALVQTVVQAPLEPGNYWLGLCIDPVEGETLKGNNCSVASVARSSADIRSADDRAGKQADSAGNGTLLAVSTGNNCNTAALACGGTATGTLDAADCDSSPRGTGFLTEPLTFSGKQGDTVYLTAEWTGLDGYLYLQDPVGEIVLENDDSDSTSASGMEVVLASTGTYTVWPTAFSQGAGGSYQLNLECNNPQAPDLQVDSPQLSTATLRSGQSLNIRTQARNNGGFTAGATTVNFILASSPQLTGGDRILRSNDVPALAGGASSIEETEVAIDATPGNYYVGVCIGQDSRETSTGNNCSVAGPITIEDTNEPIAINSGLSDAWYNPSTSGQGFLINVFPDDSQVFLSWFTFDITRPGGNAEYQLGDPGHRWLTAQGAYDLGVAEMNVFLTHGGVFDADEPSATTDPAPYGTMTLSFSDCNNGLIEYNLPSLNQSGSIPITRVSAENVATCEASLGALASNTRPVQQDEIYAIETNGSVGRVETNDVKRVGFNYNESLNDVWYNPATNGQGFFFNVFPDSNFVFLSWFTYDLLRPAPSASYILGEPGHRWLTAQGSFDGDTANMKVYRTSGGIFDAGNLPASNTVEVGTMTASFEDCNSGLISYEIDSVSRANEVPIQRTAPDSIPACEAKSSAGSPGSGIGTHGGSDGATAGVTPSGKPLLENLCNGNVEWKFDWPDIEGASYYQFELYRNDSPVDSPRVKDTPPSSEFTYSGKENPVDEAHLDNWHWRYRPVMGFGVKTRVSWSKDFYFNVKSPDSPCL